MGAGCPVLTTLILLENPVDYLEDYQHDLDVVHSVQDAMERLQLLPVHAPNDCTNYGHVVETSNCNYCGATLND